KLEPKRGGRQAALCTPRPRRHARGAGARLRRRQAIARHRGRAVPRLHPLAEGVRGLPEPAGDAGVRAAHPPRAADRQPRRRPALERALSLVRAAIGIEQAVIDAVNARKTPSLVDARERTCFAVAREILANKGLSDESYAAAEKTMGLESLVALVAAVGSFSMTCLTAATFQIDPPPTNPTPLAE